MFCVLLLSQTLFFWRGTLKTHPTHSLTHTPSPGPGLAHTHIHGFSSSSPSFSSSVDLHFRPR